MYKTQKDILDRIEQYKAIEEELGKRNKRVISQKTFTVDYGKGRS